ncbi:YidB family protein [Herbaspirillum rhizosphaerae]|uniref:YidB family protein n=1 Tax=Herbaspirillum rhizosphaerae TaxID=346179 RepID=UPI00067C74BC|nr:YidB family protein [Herbaspirillum rhizosphaerae]
MGLLDSVLGALNNNAGNASGAPADPKAALIQAVLSMLANNNNQSGGSGALAGLGGLGGLLGTLQNAGLGQIVDSWIGTGQNQPVSGDQVSQALGDDQLSGLAQATGIPQGDIAGHLAQILPGLVDHLTPGGQVPESVGGNLGSEIGNLLGGFLGGKSA